MAIIKFTNSKRGIKKILDYITQETKTEEYLITGKDCMAESALAEMEVVKNMYGKNTGRQYIHIVQSFDPKDELSHENANKIGVLLAERFVGFQAVIATHKDCNHIHNHIVLNSVNFESGLKFQQTTKELQDFKDFSDKLCLQHGLSIIENPRKNSDVQRNEYQAIIKGESWKMSLAVTIDHALEISETKEEFISNMKFLGYDVNWTDTRKNITYTTPDGQKCRDNKLHDSKYLKEEMENAFRGIERKTQDIKSSTITNNTNSSRAEIDPNDKGITGADGEPNNQRSIDVREPNNFRNVNARESNKQQIIKDREPNKQQIVKDREPNKQQISRSEKTNCTQPQRKGEPQKESILERLEIEKANVRRREDEKRNFGRFDGINSSWHSSDDFDDSDILKGKKKQNSMEL